ARENMGKMVFGMILSVCCVVFNIISPILYAMIIDDVIDGGQTSLLGPLCVGCIACAVLFVICTYSSQFLLELGSQNTERDLRKQLYAKLQKMDQNYYGANRTGDLMMKLTGDLDWVRHFTIFLIPQSITNFLTFAATLIVFLIYNWKLALMALLFTPFTVFLTVKVRRHMRPAHDRVRECVSQLNTTVQENISGNRVVKAFVREDYEMERFEEKNLAFRDASINTVRTWQRYAPILDGFSNCLNVVLLLFGGIFCITGEMTLGDLSLFMSMSWALSGPMNMIGTVINDYQRFLASAEKIMTIYFAKPEIENPARAYRPTAPRGDIEFRNVEYKYPTSKGPVLQDINLKAKAGQTIGIMGPTGCGKTTLVSMISRFMDATAGTVYVDGVDVRQYDLNALRGIIGMSMQDVFLFSETIDANISYGNPDMEEAQVIECAVDADADGFIRRTPDGYDTVIGERGVGLSGGQKQRIALARALAYDTPILILDDTTSAVDMDTEAYIQEHLRARKKKATTLIVAQRISSVRDADCIYILENGRISECGTHEELLAKRGYYYSVYCLQNGITEEGGAV
ncbi:MAG: ABC transporter ATP-binding protein, partial [Ruminococcaceae bacterium]|nr:ABC transporter ATP-binding protein [Oscillospiraceae bacterium]